MCGGACRGLCEKGRGPCRYCRAPLPVQCVDSEHRSGTGETGRCGRGASSNEWRSPHNYRRLPARAAELQCGRRDRLSAQPGGRVTPYVKWFMKSSLFWLGCGVTLGVCIAIDSRLIIYRPAHVHMNLLGFVTMMIFAVGYHVLPRIAGAPLRWEWLAPIHWWLANTGLAMMVAGFVVIPWNANVGRWILAPGGLLAALGAFCFIVT